MSKPLARQLLPHVGRPAAGKLEAWAPLEETLRALLARARAAWPKLALDDTLFLQHLGERLGPEPIAALERLHVEDLYLACACHHGVPGALEAFDAQHLSQVPQFLGARSRANADEVRQLLRLRLFVPGRDSASGLGGYSGRGALGGFVRVAAVRLAQDSVRGKAGAASSRASAQRLTAAAADPELAYMKQRHAADFRKAFEAALAGLPAEDRNILSLHFLDELTTAEIGALYRVDGSTIRRRLTRMRQALLDETRRLVGERLGLEPAELDSLLVLVRSQLDLSIRRWLQRPA